MSFCTAVNCMDGRVQLPVIAYLMNRYEVLYVDQVTEPGPIASLACPGDPEIAASILRRVAVSVDRHGSRVVAVVGHCDCTGNQLDETGQREQIREAVERIAGRFPGVEVVGLWVDCDWSVSEACMSPADGGGDVQTA